jgi:hypothetical protein
MPSVHSSKASSSPKGSKKSTHRIDGLEKKSRASRNAVGIAATVVQGICATVISQYDPSHSGLVRHPLPRNICIPSLVGTADICIISTLMFHTDQLLFNFVAPARSAPRSLFRPLCEISHGVWSCSVDLVSDSRRRRLPGLYSRIWSIAGLSDKWLDCS